MPRAARSSGDVVADRLRAAHPPERADRAGRGSTLVTPRDRAEGRLDLVRRTVEANLELELVAGDSDSASSDILPWARIRPRLKIATRSQTWWTWWRRWLDRRTVTPLSRARPLDDRQDVGHAGRVDRRGRLVEDHDRGILDQRVGQAEALAHAP